MIIEFNDNCLGTMGNPHIFNVQINTKLIQKKKEQEQRFDNNKKKNTVAPISIIDELKNKGM